MNTVTHTRTEQTRHNDLPAPSVLDRVALYGGLALIRWANRAETTPASKPRRHQARHALHAVAERRRQGEASYRIERVV